MKIFILFALLLSGVQELPFKSSDDFEIKLDYKFKQRTMDNASAVYVQETNREHDRRTSTALLPFLTLNIKLLKLSEEEVKVKIGNNINSRIVTRKVDEGLIIPLLIGFTDDAKDRVSAHHYVFTFVTAEKKETSRITIFIDEDGTFLVNGEKRGKF
jgi:hypothetical protein